MPVDSCCQCLVSSYITVTEMKSQPETLVPVGPIAYLRFFPFALTVLLVPGEMFSVVLAHSIINASQPNTRNQSELAVSQLQ